MSHITNTAGNPFLTRAYGLKSSEDCKALYDEWAATFDADLTGPEQNYVAPIHVTEAVLANNGNLNGAVFDAGCGSGLSGIPMFQAGAKTMDGVDISPGMLKVAEKTGIYRQLETADLTKPINKPNEAYDVVICVGTLTHGHVGAVPALKEFVRITKKGGLVVATILDDIWSTDGFEAEVKRLQGEGLAEFIGAESMDYRKAAGVKAKILVMRRK